MLEITASARTNKTHYNVMTCICDPQGLQLRQLTEDLIQPKFVKLRVTDRLFASCKKLDMLKVIINMSNYHYDDYENILRLYNISVNAFWVLNMINYL